MKYQYILRYLICPDFYSEQKVDELVNFCLKGKIEEVMLFLNAEELTVGHPDMTETARFVPILKAVKAKLAKHNIRISLNPWSTLFHLARGRSLKPDQKFTLMVGETGKQAKITVCPLCQNWQSYICEQFAFLCKEIKPTALWIEDDWRLHNHEEDMGWGGCFCQLHLERLAISLGYDYVSREETLAHILLLRKSNIWRQKWLDLCRDSMLEPLEKIKKAIKAVAPDVRVGLMSSVPDVHCVEGRDWHKMQKIIGFEPAFLTRPHLPPYTETYALNTTPAVTRHTIANLARPLEIYPELENSPRCGIYSKSKIYSALECCESVCYGAAGITINHFDMLGNGIELDPQFNTMLAEIKPSLDAVVDLAIDDNNAEGVNILFNPRIAYYRHIPDQEDKDIVSLQNESIAWAQVMAILGISHKFIAKVPDKKATVFVSGQTLYAFTDIEITKLLHGELICDAESTKILIERGFAQLIGIESCKWVTQDETGYAYEEFLDKDISHYGNQYSRVTASRCSNKIMQMKAVPESQTKTLIKDASHQIIAPGMIIYTNCYGGKVITTAYPLVTTQFYMGYFNIFRQRLWQNIIGEFQTAVAMAQNFPLRIYLNKILDGYFIGIVNPTLDGLDEIKITLYQLIASEYDVKILSSKGNWETVSSISVISNVLDITFNEKLLAMQTKFLKLQIHRKE